LRHSVELGNSPLCENGRKLAKSAITQLRIARLSLAQYWIWTPEAADC